MASARVGSPVCPDGYRSCTGHGPAGGVPRGPTPLFSKTVPRLRPRPLRRQVVRMWTRPADRAASYEPYGQGMDKCAALAHPLPTLPALAPTSSPLRQQRFITTTATSPAPDGSRIVPSSQEIRRRNIPVKYRGVPTRQSDKQHHPSAVAHDVQELRVRKQQGELWTDEDVGGGRVDPAPSVRSSLKELVESQTDGGQILLMGDAVSCHPAALSLCAEIPDAAEFPGSSELVGKVRLGSGAYSRCSRRCAAPCWWL